MWMHGYTLPILRGAKLNGNRRDLANGGIQRTEPWLDSMSGQIFFLSRPLASLYMKDCLAECPIFASSCAISGDSKDPCPRAMCYIMLRRACKPPLLQRSCRVEVHSTVVIKQYVVFQDLLALITNFSSEYVGPWSTGLHCCRQSANPAEHSAKPTRHSEVRKAAQQRASRTSTLVYASLVWFVIAGLMLFTLYPSQFLGPKIPGGFGKH